MPHILYVEDYINFAKNVVFALETQGFQVTHVELGSEALAYLDNNEVDLVLLDIELPESKIDGFEVLKCIRKKSDVPVIITTCKTDPTVHVHGMDVLHANDYITKPFDNAVLIAHINNQITPANDSVFKITESMQQINFKGRNLELTNLRYKLLAFLVQHPNQIHSKIKLLGAIGAPASSPDTINTHVQNIRSEFRRIEPNCKRNKYIKTHTSKGYSLVI